MLAATVAEVKFCRHSRQHLDDGFGRRWVSGRPLVWVWANRTIGESSEVGAAPGIIDPETRAVARGGL